MSFAHPKLFYLLLLLIPFIIVILVAFKQKLRALQGFISREAQEKMVLRSRPEVDFLRSGFLVVVFAFLVIALARPQWGERYERMDIRGLQLVFLLDTSRSMAAEDILPSRLEAAKNLIATCADSLRTDLVSLINFAASAYIQCPLTSDYDAFKILTQSSTLSPEEEQGTDLASAFTLAEKAFKNRRGSQNLIVLITDGEDQEHRWQSMLPRLKKEKVAIFTVGVGIPEGAPIPIKDEEGNTVDWKKDRSGEMVKTVLDEQSLQHIATETNGHYFRLSQTAGIQEFLKLMKSFERKTLDTKLKPHKIDRFYYPLIVAIMFLFLEMVLSERKLPWKKG